MARPKGGSRVGIHIYLPEELKTKVDLCLFSAVEGRVPYGAWSGLVEPFLREWLEKQGVANAGIPVPVQQRDP